MRIDGADDYARTQSRSFQRSEGCHGVIDLVIIDVRDFEHFGKFARLFANIDHADHHWRKRLTGLSGCTIDSPLSRYRALRDRASMVALPGLTGDI